MITGNEAALKVRQHFESVHGPSAVINFIVGNIKKNMKEKCWEVTCSFFPSYGAIKPLKYIVKIDIEDGSIIDQEQVNAKG
ncbi:MAG: hypothetical protein FIB08_16620 [Candidatus Methanoperedens sp.]|nr:hypothetical protein [Candidatus Methanoperedens sp.]